MAYFVRYVCAVLFVFAIFAVPAFSSPVTQIEKTVTAPVRGVGKMFHGVASFYADKFNGRKTASGEIFDNSKLTCAHRTLPFGTKILVKNPDTGSCCEVIVNDRGPYAHNRVVDLSRAAAKRLGITGLGKVVCYAGKHFKDAIDVEDKKTLVAKKDTNKVIALSQPAAEKAAVVPAGGTPAADHDSAAPADKARAD